MSDFTLEQAEAAMTFDYIQNMLDKIAESSKRMEMRSRFNSHRGMTEEKMFFYKKINEDVEKIKATYVENRDLLLKHKNFIVHESGKDQYSRLRLEAFSLLENFINTDFEKELLGAE